MKKSLLMILSAALLFVGCTKELEQKVTDLTSRVDAVEQQIAANKAAIETLQAAVQSMTGDRVTNVTETAVGWTVTLSSGKTLVLYGGSTEAVFFKSVVKGEKEVTFTLADGTTIVLPFGEEEFALKLDVDDFVIYPKTEEQVLEISYEVVGGNAQTVVDVMPSHPFGAEVKGGKIVITVPALAEDQDVPAGKIIAFADNGKGKSSIKVILINGQIVETATVAGAAPFWGGTTTVTVPSNVDVTAEVDPAAAEWCSIVETKAVTNHKITVNCEVTPLCVERSAVVYIKDPAGNVVQNVTVVQGGAMAIYGVETGKDYKTFADAVADLEKADGTTATIWVAATNGYTVSWETLIIPETSAKNWVICSREYGVPAIDPDMCRVMGIYHYAPTNLTVEGLRLCISSAKTSTTAVSGSVGNDKYLNLFIGPKCAGTVNVNNVHFFCYNTQEASSTHIVTEAGCAANVNVTACVLDGRPCKDDGTYVPNKDARQRLAQLYGGTINFSNNKIVDGYSSYGIRVGTGISATFIENLVDTPIFIDAKSKSTITLGDGKTDNNVYSENVTKVVNAADDATVLPESAKNAAPGAAGTIEWNGFKFTTIQGAVTLSDNNSTINVPAGEYKENLKIPANKTVTIIGEGEETIIAGDVEIMGDVTIKNATIQSKKDVTKKAFMAGDDFNAWWGYIVRAGAGAKVTLDNVKIYADPEYPGDTEGGQYISGLFAANANITLNNCNFDLSTGKVFAPIQFFGCNIEVKGCTFTTAETITDGCEDYVLKLAGETKAVIAGNTFNAATATWIVRDGSYNCTGKVTFGDGVVDSNVYSARVKEAISCTETEEAMTDLEINPKGLVFNAPKTESNLKKVFTKSMKELLGTTDDNCDIRQITLGTDYIYAPQATKPGVVYVINPANGEKVGSYEIPDNGGHWAIGAAATLEDGTVILANMAGALADQKLCIYKATATGAELLFEFTTVDKDGLRPRLGDMMTAYGTMEDGKILFLDYAIKAAQKYRIYEFFIENGTVSGPYVQYVPESDQDPFNKIACGIGTATKIVGCNQYFICPDSTQGLNGYQVVNRWGSGTSFGYGAIMNLDGWMYGVIPAPENGGQYRDPEFFKLGDKAYCAVLDMKMDGGTNSKGAVLKIFEHNDAYQPGDWKESTLVASADLPGTNSNRNSCASLGVQVKDGVATIAYVMRDNTLGVYKFHL